jgi:hypothetical protein
MQNPPLSQNRTEIVAVLFSHDAAEGGIPHGSNLPYGKREATREEIYKRKSSSDCRCKMNLSYLQVRAGIYRGEDSGLQSIELNPKIVHVDIDEASWTRSDFVYERRDLANVQLSCARKFAAEALHGDRNLPICKLSAWKPAIGCHDDDPEVYLV